MKDFLRMMGLIEDLWLFAAVGCLAVIIGVYIEITIKGLRKLRSEAEQRRRSKPSAAT